MVHINNNLLNPKHFNYKMFSRFISFFMCVFCILNLVFIQNGFIQNAYAAGTWQSNPYSEIKFDGVYSGVISNTTLSKNDGNYKFENVTIGAGGITISNNITVNLYFLGNCTITGGNASKASRGGAGIYVPKKSTVNIYGEGSLNINGGSGANGGDGGISGSNDKEGWGGFGGYGGNGGGAGIGSIGAWGGDGGEPTTAIFGDYPNNIIMGTPGGNGNSSPDTGSIFISHANVVCTEGLGGNGGASRHTEANKFGDTGGGGGGGAGGMAVGAGGYGGGGGGPSGGAYGYGSGSGGGGGGGYSGGGGGGGGSSSGGGGGHGKAGGGGGGGGSSEFSLDRVYGSTGGKANGEAGGTLPPDPDNKTEGNGQPGSNKEGTGAGGNGIAGLLQELYTPGRGGQYGGKGGEGGAPISDNEDYILQVKGFKGGDSGSYGNPGATSVTTEVTNLYSSTLTVTGEPNYGKVLTVSASGISTGLTYTWYRVNSKGEENYITSDTKNTYTITNSDIGCKLKVVASWFNPNGKQQIGGPKVVSGIFIKYNPEMFSRSDHNTVGDTIDVSCALQPNFESINFKWYRDGKGIPSQNSSSYKMVDEDIGRDIKVEINCANDTGFSVSFTNRCINIDVSTDNQYTLVKKTLIDGNSDINVFLKDPDDPEKSNPVKDKILADTFKIEGVSSPVAISPEVNLVLYSILLDCNEDLNGVSAILKENIDMSLYTKIRDKKATSDYRPLGKYNAPFTGNFNGNGKTISNLNLTHISSDETNFKFKSFGYFGFIRIIQKKSNSSPAPSITSLTLENCKVQGRNFVGGIVGFCVRANISHCNVDNSDISGKSDSVGGIAGAILYDSSVEHCTVSNTSIKGKKNVGEIVGDSFNNHNNLKDTNLSIGNQLSYFH